MAKPRICSDWAMKRARELFFGCDEFDADGPGIQRIAAYIREHEQPPVDPDTDLAMEIAISRGLKAQTGLIGPLTPEASAILEGIKRGRELERGE